MGRSVGLDISCVVSLFFFLLLPIYNHRIPDGVLGTVYSLHYSELWFREVI